MANDLNRKGHTERKVALVCLLLCRGFVFYALYVVEAALHLQLLLSVQQCQTWCAVKAPQSAPEWVAGFGRCEEHVDLAKGSTAS